MVGTGFNKRGTLAVICAGMAMLMLDVAVLNTALPRIADDLDASLAGIQWVVDAYTLTLATLVLTAGSVADRIGRKRVFALGLVLFTAASLACGLAGGIVALDVARALQGVGGALMFATALAMLADAFREPRERGTALAAYGAAIGASFAAGPLVGGVLTSAIGWRAVFFLNVPIGIAALLATRAWVRESRDPNPRRPDLVGQVTLSAGLLLLVLGLLRGNDIGWGSPEILAELVGGAALLAVFALVERRVVAPMLPLGLFRRPAFAAAQISAFAISASFFAVFFYTTLYLQEILGLSPIESGLMYAPGATGMFLASLAAPRLSRRFGPGALVVAGLALASVGMLLLLVTTVNASWVLFLPGATAACVGTGLFNPAVSGVLIGSVSPAQSGLASGSGIAFRQAGITVGIAVFGTLVPAAAAVGHGSPEAFVDGLHHALLGGAVLAALGAIVVTPLLGVARRWAPASVQTAGSSVD